MSISASKCPFFSSTIEIVRNLKISKLQLAIGFSDGLGSISPLWQLFLRWDVWIFRQPRLTVQICHRFLHLDSHSWISWPRLMGNAIIATRGVWRLVFDIYDFQLPWKLMKKMNIIFWKSTLILTCYNNSSANANI